MRPILNSISDSAASAGKGALAGAVATALMTVSSTLEMKIRDRSPSDVPAAVAGKVLGVQPRNPEGRRRFGAFAHWGYGTAWGVVGGMIHHWTPNPGAATCIHFGSVWGTEVTMLPALDEAPPLTEWGCGGDLDRRSPSRRVRACLRRRLVPPESP
ncbi:MAG TPA: hypothetical protein VF115_14815 [Acidimicrobiia bacterium]